MSNVETSGRVRSSHYSVRPHLTQWSSDASCSSPRLMTEQEIQCRNLLRTFLNCKNTNGQLPTRTQIPNRKSWASLFPHRLSSYKVNDFSQSLYREFPPLKYSSTTAVWQRLFGRRNEAVLHKAFFYTLSFTGLQAISKDLHDIVSFRKTAALIRVRFLG